MHPLWPVTAPLLAVSVWKEGNLFRSRKANTLFYALMAAPVYRGIHCPDGDAVPRIRADGFQ